MSRILIVRPSPGSEATAASAVAHGLDPVVAPIFRIDALAWEAPDPAGVEAIMLTSSNAARQAGAALQPFLGHICYAVGESTAAAARNAGFADVRTGPSNGAALARLTAGDGICRALHLCGRDHAAIEEPGLVVTRRFVYAAEPLSPLPDAAREALAEGALVLLHSPRGAAHFARLVDEACIARSRICLAAISPATAAAAGEGWGERIASDVPRDAALLELAAKLCNSKTNSIGPSGE